MTDYFVRKTGLDSNNGLTAGAAFLTIDKAANTVSAGDTVYVGAGVYREIVTMDTSGSSGSPITFVADVDGEQTGDAGLVVVSAYNSDTGLAVRAWCVSINTRTYITWRGFVLNGGTLAVIGSDETSNLDGEGIIVEDCAIISGHDSTDVGFHYHYNAQTSSPTGDGITIRRCYVHGTAGIYFKFDGNETGQVDMKVTIESCVIYATQRGPSTLNSSVYWSKDSAGTHGAGGCAITNCTLLSINYCVSVSDGASTTYPVDVRNCILRGTTGFWKSTTNDGALTSDYNRLSCTGDYTNVTAGSNDTASSAGSFHGMGGVMDMLLYKYWGWSPFRPWEHIRLQDDAYLPGVIGGANTADAPAFDLYNESRPMYGTVDDVGAVEGRARPEQETTTVRTGSNAIRFEGAGFQDIFLPVNDASITVSVYGRYDSNYTGTLPQLQVLNIPGVADQTDTMTGGANAWEQLSVTFTPTSKGIARIRLVSNDTSATGESFFDDLDIT